VTKDELQKEFGKLELERRVHLGRLQAVEQLQQKLIAEMQKNGDAPHPTVSPSRPKNKCNK
jgi:hypothetical protein